jgi:hypothetical protein
MTIVKRVFQLASASLLILSAVPSSSIERTRWHQFQPIGEINRVVWNGNRSRVDIGGVAADSSMVKLNVLLDPLQSVYRPNLSINSGEGLSASVTERNF